MPLSPVILIYAPDGKPIPGPVPVNDPAAGDLTGCFGEEFLHRVYTIKKDYFYSLLYGVDFVRKHDPMTIVKQIDKMSVPLMKCLTCGTFLQKVEIRWYHFDKKNNEEYFRMTLEHVRLEKIRYLIPDVKATEFERYGHLEELQLVFQKITWLYPKGYLTYTDIWNEAYSEVDQKNFGGKKDETEELTETPMVDTLTIKFTSGKFTEPKEGFKFDAKAKVTFTYTANRKPDGKENKVYAKLYAVCNGKTEDLRQTNEGRLVSGDSWSTEFKLKKPEGLKSDSDTVEYYAEIENTAAGTFKSEYCQIGKKIKNVNVLEIEDALFRHNSAVFLPDRDERQETGTAKQEKLTGLEVIRAILNRVTSYPDQKLLIAGHTDTSGPDDYNFMLSKERADSVLHVLENKKEAWAAIADRRHKNEDIQHVVSWSAKTRGWNCDPGGVDGIIGPKTKAAIKEFHDKSGAGSGETFTAASWGAVFELYQKELAKKMSADENEKTALENRTNIAWAYGDSHKAVGCGELWPLEHVGKDDMKSQTNRRVEALFFEDKEIGECKCKDGACDKNECPVYAEGLFKRKYIKVDGSEDNSDTRVVIHIEMEETDPDASNCNDMYRLFSIGTPAEYNQSKSLQDDRKVKDGFLELHFTDVIAALNYSLEVDPGEGAEKYLLFEDVPYSDMETE